MPYKARRTAPPLGLSHSPLICFPCLHLSSQLSFFPFFYFSLNRTALTCDFEVILRKQESASAPRPLWTTFRGGCSVISLPSSFLLQKERYLRSPRLDRGVCGTWQNTNNNDDGGDKNKERAASTQRAPRMLVLHAAEGVVLH